MKNLKNCNSGFSTIELLFALAIFSILFISTSSLIMSTVKISQISKEYYEASLLAQKHYEAIKASSHVLEAHTDYKYDDFIVSIDILNIPEYNGKLFKLVVTVSKGEQALDKIEGLKTISKQE